MAPVGGLVAGGVVMATSAQPPRVHRTRVIPRRTIPPFAPASGQRHHDDQDQTYPHKSNDEDHFLKGG